MQQSNDLARDQSASVILMPAPPSSDWWRQLTTKSGEREIERAAAEKVCRLIVEDVFGRLRAQQTPISFDDSTPILLRDMHSAIQALCGADDWLPCVGVGRLSNGQADYYARDSGSQG